jgi:hypothetical protein
MTTYELVVVAIALGAISVPIVTWAVLWLIRRDKIFADLPPGEIPVDPEEAPTSYVSRGAHYVGEVEARSTPPAGVSPGLGGVVIDGSADGRDIAAMILDLARLGWLQLKQVSGTGSAGGDWAITRVEQPLDGTLDLNEVHLITNIAPPGGTAWLSELCSASDNRLALVQQDLHREVVARGWYSGAPHQTSDIPMAVLGVGGLLGLVIPLIHVSTVAIGAGAVILAGAFLTSLVVRGATPRTALGTAVRIQSLGLRRYLDEARSYQFSYTDALETFRTYLPWAVVFELESQWADVFATFDVVAQTSELQFARDLGWFANIRDRDRLVPPTVPVGEVTAPRRVAYCEEDVISTVLATADEVAAEKLAAASNEAITQGSSDGVHVPAPDRAPTAPAPRAALGVASRIGSGTRPGKRRRPATVAALWRRPRTDDQDPAPVVPPSPAPAPATSAEVLLSAEPAEVPTTAVGVVAEAVSSVRQWVPKASARSAALDTRTKPPADAVQAPTTPAALVTPVRVPAAEETPVTRARIREATVEGSRSEATIFSDWMSEFDLAMTGDVEDKDFEATDGGTVITGPERFDVLLAPPLWPDVPVRASERTRRVR